MTEDVDALLKRLRAGREDPVQALEQLRARTRDIRATFAEVVRNDKDGLPPEIVAALVAATGPTSPVQFQRIGRLVADGVLTWTDFYADPEGTAGPEGRELVRRAIHSAPTLPEVSEADAEEIRNDPGTRRAPE